MPRYNISVSLSTLFSERSRSLGVPVHSVSPHFMCLFPLRKYLRESLGEENRVSVVRGGQCPWDGEEENNQSKFKSSHPLLGL